MLKQKMVWITVAAFGVLFAGYELGKRRRDRKNK